MKTKLLIFYASYGNGHKSIAKYIENYFSNNSDNYEILTVDILENTSHFMGPFTRKIGSKIVLARVPIIWGMLYRFFDHRYSTYGSDKILSKLFDNKKLQKKIKEFNPDITISTHFFCSDLISRYERKDILHTRLITIITDYKEHEFWLKNSKTEEAIIVSSKEVKRNLINKNIPKNKIYGLPISNRFYETHFDKESLEKKYNINKNLPTYLFFGGGGNGTMASYIYIKKLIKSNIDVNLFFISGKNEELKHKVELLVKKYNKKNIRVLGFIDYVPELLFISDLVITKPGGITITECLCLGKPMVLINKNAGQEKDNYKYLVRKGYALKASNPFTFMTYLKMINNSNALLKRMKNNLLKQEKNNAMKKLFELVEKM